MENILEMKNISKIYGNGVIANEDVNLAVEPGEIHGLMGENGAGKSTLMKILFGIENPDKGKILYKNKEVNIKNPTDAIRLGIGMVNQHFMLVDKLTVYENVILGNEPLKKGFIDSQEAINIVKNIGDKYNLDVEPNSIIENISVGQKQKVEILKVLSKGVDLLILDEPTAVLTPQETQELFEQFLLLKKAGITIIFISHKIKEVMQICDRLTVLKKGRTVDTVRVDRTNPEKISKLMVGRDVLLSVNKTNRKIEENILEVRNLSWKNADNIKVLKNVNLRLEKGEILGIAGVDGNGQNELVENIMGIHEMTKGEITLRGEPIDSLSTAERRKKGLSYIPEDRMTKGLANNLSIKENTISDKLNTSQFKKKMLLDTDAIETFSNQLLKEYEINTDDINTSVNMLSGGNMQKVVIAREFSSEPEVLIANQPTRGVDVGSIEFIWKKLLELRDNGKSIILVSADLNEILELSDSIAVMNSGEIVADLENNDNIDEFELGSYMLGLKKQSDSKEVI